MAALQDIWSGFVKSCAMVLVSEIGDKTFFIAAIMAMRNSRLQVLLGALSALIAMTVLSAAMGAVAPNLISKAYTKMAAVFLFFFFGCRLIYTSLQMKGDESWGELAEVEAELKEAGDKEKKAARSMWRRTLGGIFSPVLIEAFTLTFLAEWGDRSQLATIGLAASTNVVGVTLGGIVGHTVCTTVAVIGGRHCATALSERMVGLCGGALFLVFGAHALLYGEE